MMQINQRIKSIVKLVAAAFFLILGCVMFFPWIDWEEQESITGTVKTLTISQSKYGSTPFYVVALEDGKTVRVKAPLSSDFKNGDVVEIRLFMGKNNENLRHYVLNMPPSNE